MVKVGKKESLNVVRERKKKTEEPEPELGFFFTDTAD